MLSDFDAMTLIVAKLTYAQASLAARVCTVWREASRTALQQWQLIDVDAANRGRKGANLGELHRPRSLFTLSQDELGVIDFKNARLQFFRPSPTLLTRAFRPREILGSLPLHTPLVIAACAHGDTVYLCDKSAGTLERRSLARNPDGELCFLSSERFCSGPCTVQDPCGVAVDEGGRIYVLEHRDHRVSVFQFSDGPDGPERPERGFTRMAHTIGGMGTADGELSYPQGVAVAHVKDGGEVFVADTMNSRVSVFDRSGAFRRNIGRMLPRPAHLAECMRDPSPPLPLPPGCLYAPMDVHIVRARVVVLEQQRITVFTMAGDVCQVVGEPCSARLETLWGIASHDDRLYVSNWRDNHIRAHRILHVS